MKINIETILKNTEGKPLTETVNGQIRPIVLEVVLRAALMTAIPDDNRSKKESDFMLLMRLVALKNTKNTELEISSEEVARIKEKVYHLYDILIAGQVDYLLEGKTLPF